MNVKKLADDPFLFGFCLFLGVLAVGFREGIFLAVGFREGIPG